MNYDWMKFPYLKVLRVNFNATNKCITDIIEKRGIHIVSVRSNMNINPCNDFGLKNIPSDIRLCLDE